MDMTMISLFGLGIGVTAHLLDKNREDTTLIGSVTLGVVGALCGGIIAYLVFGNGVRGLQFTAFMIAAGVALILFYARKALRT